MRFAGIFSLIGLGSVSPLIVGQTTGAPAAGDAATWLTGGTVIAITGLFYRFMQQRITKLEAQVDQLTKAAELRAEEDRKLLIPLLSRSVEAQSAYLARRLDFEQEQR